MLSDPTHYTAPIHKFIPKKSEEITPSILGLRHTHTPHFFSLNSSETIKEILSLQYSHFIEINQHDKLESLLGSITKNVPDIMLSITTATCYSNNTAWNFTDMISERFGLSEEKTSDIATCLHEAIMNSILHGNLGVHPRFNTLNDFEAHQTQIEQRLTIDKYKYRRICISAWDGHNRIKISVSDEGKGFNLENSLPSNTNTHPNTPHGRGLLFIKEMSDNMWLGEDKRTLFTSFNY